MKNRNNDNNELTPKEKREKIKKIILNKEYGETISYNELNQIFKEDLRDSYGRNVLRRQMNIVKNELFNEGYVIRPIYHVGYYILKPNQVSSYTYRNYIVKPMNSFKKAKVILNNTEKKKLKGQEISEYALTYKLNEEIIHANTEIINLEEYCVLKKISK